MNRFIRPTQNTKVGSQETVLDNSQILPRYSIYSAAILLLAPFMGIATSTALVTSVGVIVAKRLSTGR